MTTIRIPQTSNATANRDPNKPLMLASKLTINLRSKSVSVDNATLVMMLDYLLIPEQAQPLTVSHSPSELQTISSTIICLFWHI